MNHSCHHKNIFKKRFYICLILTIPVLLLSPMIQSFFNINISFWSDKYLLFAFSTIIFIYGGYPFLSGMFYEIKNKMPGMMTLISLAILVAYFYSSSVIFFIKGKLFFWELATLIDIMLLGHWIEMKSITSALGALEELSKLIPSEAHVILDDGTIKNVPTKQLQIGNIVLIKPGEQIPCDGKVIDGQSDVNESLITGESKPVFKEKDMKIIAGTINETGSLTIIVDKTEKESYISKVIQLVKTASESKSKAQTIADKAAFILTIISISVGILTLISWIIIQHDFVFALERMVTVMIITCPHALGLAIPLVIATVTSLSAKNGLLIKNRAAFENAFKMNSFVFDKTGTLTKGEFEVSDIFSINNFSEENILKYAASLDLLSEHSIAKSIVSSAKDKNIDLIKVENFKALPGIGASCTINNDHVLLKKYNFKDFSNDQTKKFSKEKKTIISLFINNKIQGIITLKDSLRDESISTIKYLKSKKIKTIMITGDNYDIAKNVAKELNIDSFYAEVLPEEKYLKIKKFQKNNKLIAMVGDGINDAPSLVQANLGIAIGSGTDTAIESADIIIADDNPKKIIDIIKLSKITNRKMIQNLLWATLYNVIAIPLAAGVFYKFNIILSPAVGAIVMSLSTIIVAINAKLIKY